MHVDLKSSTQEAKEAAGGLHDLDNPEPDELVAALRGYGFSWGRFVFRGDNQPLLKAIRQALPS